MLIVPFLFLTFIPNFVSMWYAIILCPFVKCQQYRSGPSRYLFKWKPGITPIKRKPEIRLNVNPVPKWESIKRESLPLGFEMPGLMPSSQLAFISLLVYVFFSRIRRRAAYHYIKREKKRSRTNYTASLRIKLWGAENSIQIVTLKRKC